MVRLVPEHTFRFLFPVDSFDNLDVVSHKNIEKQILLLSPKRQNAVFFQELLLGFRQIPPNPWFLLFESKFVLYHGLCFDSVAQLHDFKHVVIWDYTVCVGVEEFECKLLQVSFVLVENAFYPMDIIMFVNILDKVAKFIRDNLYDFSSNWVFVTFS